MTDPDGDGVWSVTVDLGLGDFEYKYAVDGFAGQEDLVDDHFCWCKYLCSNN